MKLKIQLLEGYHTTNWKEPIEIETDDYPELKDMSETEVLEFLNEQASNLPATPGSDPDEWSLFEDMMEQDTELSKEKMYETSIAIWTK